MYEGHYSYVSKSHFPQPTSAGVPLHSLPVAATDVFKY